MDETKQFYMEHGICYACGQERAEPGKKRCWRCLANNNDASKLYYGGLSPEKKEKLIERRGQAAKERYAERKKAGLCPACGKENPNKNFVMCPVCREHSRKCKAKLRRKGTRLTMQMRADGHRCFLCTKEIPLVPGKKLCPECYKKTCENLKKACPDTSGRSWRTTNDLFFQRKGVKNNGT